MQLMWNKGTSTVSFISETVEVIISYMNKENLSLLDLGCGKGVYGYILRAYIGDNLYIDGVDLDLDNTILDILNLVYDNVFNSDILEFPIPKDKYAIIFCNHILEHIEKAKAISFMEYLKTLGSTVIIGLPNSRKNYTYNAKSIHDHRWGIYDFPFNDLGYFFYDKAKKNKIFVYDNGRSMKGKLF